MAISAIFVCGICVGVFVMALTDFIDYCIVNEDER